MNLTMNEAKIRVTLDSLTNDTGAIDVPEEWVEAAGEEFKSALRKQLHRTPQAFRLRMSNIGKPLCQLQMEKLASEADSDISVPRRPYNHIMRMMIGDSVEVLTRLIMRVAGVNVTSHGDHVELEVAGEVIKGDSDIDTDGRVDDIKSCSPWAFRNKWQRGYPELAANDSFGYVGQLIGYSDGQGKELGGWWVVDKSSGEVLFLEAEPTEEELAAIRKQREETVIAIRDGKPFERCFEPVPETYYRKETGAKRVPEKCDFCDFKHTCWPTAQFLPQPGSKARNPARHWYVEHPDMETSA